MGQDRLGQRAPRTVRWLALLVTIAAILLLAACSTTNDEAPQPANSNGAETEVITADDSAGYPGEGEALDSYPGAAAEEATKDPSYPAPALYEDLLNEPPNPELTLPPTSDELGAVGGALIREVVDFGFEPLTPAALLLAEVLLTSDGRPALLRAGDGSLMAQLFPTGIFVFQNVPPGEYGLMVDVGYTQFPITGDDGSPLLFTVEAGKALDLGQIITELPGG